MNIQQQHTGKNEMKSEKRNQQQQQKKRRNVVKIKANEHGEKNVHAFASNSKIFFRYFCVRMFHSL